MDVDWLSVEMVVRDVVVKSVLKGRAYCEILVSVVVVPATA